MTDPFARIRALFGKPDPGERDQARQISELYDSYHPRASVSDGDTMVIDAGQVLENIRLAMERIDLDINTGVAIDDVVPVTVLWALVSNLGMGPTLAVHVVNTGMRIMSNRYPAELATGPLPPECDVRTMVPLDFSDEQHETARLIFNRRAVSAEDLDEGDIADLMGHLNAADQTQVFIALFCMYGVKVSAIQQRLGIE